MNVNDLGSHSARKGAATFACCSTQRRISKSLSFQTNFCRTCSNALSWTIQFFEKFNEDAPLAFLWSTFFMSSHVNPPVQTILFAMVIVSLVSIWFDRFPLTPFHHNCTYPNLHDDNEESLSSFSGWMKEGDWDDNEELKEKME